MASVKKARVNMLSDWKLAAAIATSVCALTCLAWLYSIYSNQSSATNTQHPEPVWLGTSKVRSQLENGQQLAFNVNLQVKKKDDLKALKPHVPAIESMMHELGQDMSPDQLTSGDGMEALSQDIRKSVNNYLRKQKVEPRVMTVAFEQFFVQP